MNKYLFKAGSQEWHDFRNKHLTGTEIASLFTLNPSKSITKIMREKISGKCDLISDNKYMRAGRLFEPSVVIALNEINLKCYPAADFGLVNVMELDNISVSLDAHNLEDNIMVEAKTTIMKNKFKEWEKGSLSKAYLLQVQTGLLVGNFNYGILACLGIFKDYERLDETIEDFPLQVYKVMPCEKLQKIIIDTVNRFWDNKIKGEKFKISQEDKKEISKLLQNTVIRYEV